MPFGLKFDAGAVLRLDEGSGADALFHPHGARCLPPVSFPTVVTGTISRVKTLTVAAQNISNGQAVVFTVSLNR